MPETTPGSWQPDPFGRFAQRYWDGASWTENVTDASGAQTTDPPVPSATPTYAMSPPTGRTLPVPGLIVAGIGLLLVLLSDFALTWFSNRGLDVNLSDLRDLASEADDVPFFVDQYLTWGWLLGLAVAALAVVALFVPTLRLAVVAVAVLMAVWHGWAVYDTGSDRISPEIGAWLGSVGFAACAVALLLPRPATAKS
jgi:hypothetical protein